MLKNIPGSDDKHFSITITAKTLFSIAVFLLVLVGLYQLRSLVLVIITAVVFASVIEPGTKWFVRHKIPRILSAILMYSLVVACIVGVFIFLLPPLFSETTSALTGIPKYIQTVDILHPLSKSTFLEIKKIFPSLPDTISIGDLVTQGTATISSFSGGLFDTASNFLGGVISLILMIVISFYLSVREDGVGEFLGLITPIKYERYVRSLWRRSENKIGKWMQGQLLLGVVIGIMVYVGLVIVHIPHPLVLAVLAAIFELIPIVGMTLSAIPAFLLAVLDGGIGFGLIVIAIYLFIQQVEANIIYPLVVKKIVGVPPLLVIIALFAGAELAGVIGALLALPVSVVIMEYFDDVEHYKRAIIEPGIEVTEKDTPHKV